MSAQELLAEIHKLPPEEQRRLLDALARDQSEGRKLHQPIAEDEVEQILLAKGIISEIPERRDDEEEETYEPIEVPGKPLSETMIEERR